MLQEDLQADLNGQSLRRASKGSRRLEVREALACLRGPSPYRMLSVHGDAEGNKLCVCVCVCIPPDNVFEIHL